ncbi:anillin-like isoform X2 [Diorhabda sublineata]|uniref:anillin-like isoform X2 n=1 Tax=Diorhabda sublineata TaxID=1163346 RepID=UPI0024E0CC77|nr:anillin-like isoform X2 [Diorhabda sublineata]
MENKMHPYEMIPTQEDYVGTKAVKNMDNFDISTSPGKGSSSFKECKTNDNTNVSYRNTENNKVKENLLYNRAATVDRLQINKNRLSTLTLNTDSDGRFIQNNFGNDVNPKESHQGSKNKRPIMGKTALLRNSSVESNDSAIIQSIILNKYENILNYYVSRMYTRRISRISNNSEEETVANTNCDECGSINTLDGYSFIKKDLIGSTDFNIEFTQDISNDSNSSEVDVISSCSEYDPRSFLVEALGDAASLNELSACNCDSNMEACEESIGTSGISSLLSTTSIGSSLKRILKRNKSKWTSRSDVTKNEEIIFDENKDCPSPEKPISTLDQYKLELSKQHSIIFQTSKALSYCKSSKNFIVGRERIEAERILLIATITKQALVNEINVIEFESYVSAADSRCTGEILLSDVTFTQNKETTSKKFTDCQEYFIVVLKSGKYVLDSGIIEDMDRTVSVPKTFKFSKLHQDFDITIAVYSLLIVDENCVYQNGKCPSPRSIIRCNKNLKSNPRNTFIQTENTAFNLIGKCNIRHSDLRKISDDGNLHVKWDYICSNNPLLPFFDMNVQYTYKLTNKLTGFLTVGIENGVITWNRRWCILDGFILQYWNYPSEESTVPIDVVDLRYCTELKITFADRSACARPRTLYLPLRDYLDIKKYFISADNLSDLKAWESELNFVVQSLLSWNGLKNNMYS